jgi:hypothetical protein
MSKLESVKQHGLISVDIVIHKLNIHTNTQSKDISVTRT